MHRLHCSNPRAAHFGVIALSACAVACGGETLSTAKYASTLDAEQQKQWATLQTGQKLALYAPSGSCQVQFADSFAELDKGGAKPLAGDPLGTHLQVIQITDSKVHTGLSGYVALGVTFEDGSKHWLQLPAGATHGCLQAVPPDLDAARAMMGKAFVFTPWAPECTEVEAVGRSPQAMLLDAEGDLAFTVEGLALGPARARDLAAGKSGNHVWAAVAKATLLVRSDLVTKCFSAPGTPGATRPDGPLPLLRTSAGRCESNDDGGRRHVECRSSLGLWEGAATDSAIELFAVRRTLGAVHFLDGRLVDGSRFARTIVSITMGSAADARRRGLYSVIDGSISAALARDASGVRIAPESSPDVTYRVHVDAGEVQIGDLQTNQVPLTSQYKVRDDVKPNPDKPAAVQRVSTARDQVSQAETNYQQAKADWAQAKEKALEECRNYAAQQTGAAGIIASAGCAAADGLLQPSDSDVVSARSELASAESALGSMPDTISVPVMADWSYTKKEYTRTASGSLTVTMQAKGWAQPRVVTTPLAYTWQDFEVEGDATHNVEGHAPDRGPISDTEALVPYIARAASDDIAGRIHTAVSEAVVERARAAMAEAGIEATRPGFETVDAMAFEMAGVRLKKPLLRGSTQLGPKPVVLPTEAVAIGQNECLTAVAVAAPGSSGSVILRSADSQYADLRGVGFAVIELCSAELSANRVPSVELSGQGGGEVRWTLYKTSAEAPQSPDAHTVDQVMGGH